MLYPLWSFMLCSYSHGTLGFIFNQFSALWCCQNVVLNSDLWPWYVNIRREVGSSCGAVENYWMEDLPLVNKEGHVPRHELRDFEPTVPTLPNGVAVLIAQTDPCNRTELDQMVYFFVTLPTTVIHEYKERGGFIVSSFYSYHREILLVPSW